MVVVVVVVNGMALNLPDGFEDASEDVQKELLTSRPSEELASEISELVGEDAPRSGQLNKRHKAAIIIALR